VRNGNLFGRGTADDKGQVHIHMKALAALQQVNGKFPINMKVLIEGEEEVGSVSLWDFVQKNKEKLKADALLVSDTSMLGKGVPSITYGLRGLNYYQIELTGPERDLHSGVYGGAVPNPLTILTELFAKLHDKNYRVTVPGFYDQVAKASKAERKALNALPWKKKDFEKAVGAPGYFGETGFTTVERLWIRPTFELNGILHAPRSEPGAAEDRQTRGETHSKAASEDRSLQVRCLEHGKALGRSLPESDFQEGAERPGKRLRQESRVHSRGRFHSLRDSNV
jgi:hypothetical protein